MKNRLLITHPQEAPLKDYVIAESCARRGRLKAYYEVADRIGVPRTDIYRKKKFRDKPQIQLTQQEIEQFVFGKTLRRPCFDLVFLADGTAKASWVDSLDDTEQNLASSIRERLQLTHKPDESYAVPVFNTGTWKWNPEKPNSIIRDFGTCYPKPFATEFFFQENGLISIASNNLHGIYWYDLLILDKDDLLDDFGVSWSDIENVTNVSSNNQREQKANLVPQFRGDTEIRIPGQEVDAAG